MKTYAPSTAGSLFALAVAAAALAASFCASALTLSPPVAADTALATKPADSAGAAAAPGGAALPAGRGAGVHSPLSPIAPLPVRRDVVAWSVLTDVQTQVKNKRIVPVFPAPVSAMNRKKLRLQGFMMPLNPGEEQSHFLLASVPLTCSFCTPGGPESMVEVRTQKPVKYSLGAVVVEGQFHVLSNDPMGMYYRITDAVGVK